MLLNAQGVAVAEMESCQNAAFSHDLETRKPLEKVGNMAAEALPLPSARLPAPHDIFALRYTMSAVCSRSCLLRMKFWMLTYCPQQVTPPGGCTGRREQAVKQPVWDQSFPPAYSMGQLYI